MAKNSIRDYANAAASNTDVQSQNIDEGCSPAGINNAIREVMADLADVNDGTIKLVSPSFDAATIGSNAIDAFPSGTKMLFQQTAAPTGWTKDTTHNDKALRITSGTVSTGGSVAFETAFASQTPAGSVALTIAGHALSISEIPSHRHFAFTTSIKSTADADPTSTTQVAKARGAGGDASNDFKYSTAADSNEATIGQTSPTGGSATHTHSGSTATFTGTAINLDVSYVDVIIAAKD
jgi:hypothetical protein